MIKHDPLINEIAYGNMVDSISESKNISQADAKKLLQAMSFQEYLSVLENITPPSGNTIAPGAKTVGRPANSMPKPPTTPSTSSTKPANPNWPGGNAPLEAGMSVGMKDASGKPTQGIVSKVDKLANGAKVRNPVTGKEEWTNLSMLEPASLATEDQDSDDDLTRLKELAGIQESASSGATGAGAIAVAPTAMGSMNKRTTTESPRKEYRPKAPPKTIVGDTKPGQASGELSATLAANGKKTASRSNNGFKK